MLRCRTRLLLRWFLGRGLLKIWVLGLACAWGPGHAADVAGSAGAAPTTAGVVKRVVGEATLQRDSVTLPLATGQRVQVGDLIRTGKDGQVSLTLADDTLLSTGPGSELVVSQFAFDSTTHEGGMLLSLWRGVLSVVTGVVAKKSPEKVNVQTRTVVLGVRGTEFIVDTGEALQ